MKDLKLTKIIKIEKQNERKHVYDLEIDNIHAFSARNFESKFHSISHNSSLIVFSDVDDNEMRNAKSGNWWIENKYRSNANVSIAYQEKPDLVSFLNEWISLYNSKSGERGIFSLGSVKTKFDKLNFEIENRRIFNKDIHTNPCSEILLNSKQFCNLTECVLRPDDTIEIIKQKVEFAVILGTFQATLTNFRYLSNEWKKNCEEEYLLGVSLTGIFDNQFIINKFFNNEIQELEEFFDTLRKYAIQINQKWAKRLGIKPAAAITCVKPSGTVSLLVDSSSGIHPRYAEYYIRSVEVTKGEPMSKFLIEQKVSYEISDRDNNKYLFKFALKSPEKSIIKNKITAINQMQLWKIINEAWCEHKPSATIYVKDNEWLEVANWVWNNFDSISGLSFLPSFEGSTIYKQLPYREITKEEYDKFQETFPKKIEWEKLAEYEKDDYTESGREFACSGGACELT